MFFNVCVCVNKYIRDGICKIGHMRVDHMTTDLRDVWAKYVGISKDKLWGK